MIEGITTSTPVTIGVVLVLAGGCVAVGKLYGRVKALEDNEKRQDDELQAGRKVFEDMAKSGLYNESRLSRMEANQVAQSEDLKEIKAILREKV